MRTTLRTLEGLLLEGSGRTARRNAWQAVLEDRVRARDRAETERLLTAMSSPLKPAPRTAAVTGSQPVPPAGAGTLLHAT
ncbi:hypothetical protein N566_17920 [Streptomycetaceae bacterium MP113-05]|nr:hypothetical protein N566_17920 [Streptomycetaceae bacterium MP113-05]